MDELFKNWDKILQKFKSDYGVHDVSFKTWISPLKILSVDGNNVKLVSSEESIGFTLIEERYLKPLEVTISEFLGDHYTVSLVSSKEVPKPVAEKPKKQVRTGSGFNLNPNYTFEKFVVGPNNNLAHAASLSVAELPGKVYNPLFLHGDVGLGKTHLMQAIAHFISENNPDLKVLYVTSETFTNELIESVKTSKNTEFREKYRSLDVLLIDDIQFIIGKESTQEEFFHTFNSLYQSGKQIVITSDKPPKEMETLAERLRTRFSEGLICDIQIPTYETKMAILNKKIEERKLDNIPDEIRDYIAKNIKSSIRELEGAITKLSAYADLTGSPIDMALAEEALKDFIYPNQKREITPELIIEVVSEHFGVSVDDIKSSKKSAEIVYPRQVSMYLCRQMTQESSSTIAKKLGRDDHSTVLYGSKKIATEILNDEQKKNTIDILIKKIDPS